MDFASVIGQILPSVREIIIAPFSKPSLIWQLAPIFFLWILMEFYFGTHKRETLGWNTSLGNGVSLFWIVISAMQHIFSNIHDHFSFVKFGAILLVAFYALFVIFISFKHVFPAKLTFNLSAPTPLFFFSTMVLLFAHDLIAITTPVLLAILLLYALLTVFIIILKKILPQTKLKHSSADTNDFGSSSSFDDPLPSSDDLDKFDPTKTESEPMPGDLEKEVSSPIDTSTDSLFK